MSTFSIAVACDMAISKFPVCTEIGPALGSVVLAESYTVDSRGVPVE